MSARTTQSRVAFRQRVVAAKASPQKSVGGESQDSPPTSVRLAFPRSHCGEVSHHLLHLLAPAVRTHHSTLLHLGDMQDQGEFLLAILTVKRVLGHRQSPAVIVPPFAPQGNSNPLTCALHPGFRHHGEPERRHHCALQRSRRRHHPMADWEAESRSGSEPESWSGWEAGSTSG